MVCSERKLEEDHYIQAKKNKMIRSDVTIDEEKQFKTTVLYYGSTRQGIEISFLQSTRMANNYPDSAKRLPSGMTCLRKDATALFIIKKGRVNDPEENTDAVSYD